MRLRNFETPNHQAAQGVFVKCKMMSMAMCILSHFEVRTGDVLVLNLCVEDEELRSLTMMCCRLGMMPNWQRSLQHFSDALAGF
jgi:hypothetical protein